MRTAEPPTGSLVLRLFGPFEAYVNGVPLPPVRSRKILWALALLALRHGRAVDREWLARTLWPEANLPQALANLRPALSALRTALGTEAHRIEAPDRRKLRLNLDGTFTDVALFDPAVASPRSADLERAVDLYRGPLLEGCGEEWVFQERDSRERACMGALVRLGEIATLRGDFSTAAEHCRRAAAIQPLADAPRRGLMEALAQGGDRNGALDVYRQFADLLRAEINLEPNEETSRLYHRLRRQIQEEDRGVAPRAEPSRTAGRLPNPLANLVGREEERTEVALELRRSRLVTLVGPGGIGKTRLAIETARSVATEYPDGAWFIGLEALSNQDLLERHVASVFELREDPGRSLASVVADLLRPKRLLLVLDNCEHLLGATARFADWLLRECAGVRILATSRESLGLSGERLWSVPSLPYPNLDHLPESPTTRRRVVAGYESVELFVERATAATRDFVLTSANATAVAQICAHVEGMPLAIELAATRTKAMTVDEIALRLGEGLHLLKGGRNLPSRQRTLRATLDWSYGLLGEDERRILRRLSVFSGGWMLRAAECVVAGGEIAEGDVVDLLESLVDKSLVGFDDARGRYRLSEPIRQYALEMREGADDDEAVTRAHADWCIGLAETGDAHLRGRDHRVWMARLLEERDNFRAVLERRPTLRLAAALARFWHIRGDYGEGIRYLKEALSPVSDEESAETRAKSFAGLGDLYLAQSEYAKANACFEASLALGHAGSLNRMAWLAHEQGDEDEAIRLGEESLSAARLFGDRREIANCLMTTAEIRLARSGRTSGKELIAEALPLYRALEDEIGTANCLVRFAHSFRDRQDSAATQSQFLEAIRIFEALEDRSGLAVAHVALAHESMRTGANSDAVDHWRKALTLYEALGDKRWVVITSAFLGKVLATMGGHAEARERLRESLVLSQTVGAKGGAITSVECLIALVIRSHRYDLAAQLIAYSDFLRRTVGAPRGPRGMAERAEQVAESLAVLGEDRFREEWAKGESLDVARLLALIADL